MEQVQADTTLADADREAQLAQLSLDRSSVQTENSYLGRVGKVIAPVFRPLGFDWKMSVSLLTGFAAKEIVVSSMGVLYHADTDADEHSSALQSSIQAQTWTSGKLAGHKVFTPLVAYAFMIFILLYVPCVATVSAVFKEAGGKWAAFSVIFNTSVAWIVAFLIYQIGMLV